MCVAHTSVGCAHICTYDSTCSAFYVRTYASTWTRVLQPPSKRNTQIRARSPAYTRTHATDRAPAHLPTYLRVAVFLGSRLWSNVAQVPLAPNAGNVSRRWRRRRSTAVVCSTVTVGCSTSFVVFTAASFIAVHEVCNREPAHIHYMVGAAAFIHSFIHSFSYYEPR